MLPHSFAGQYLHPKAKHLHNVPPTSLTNAQKAMIPTGAGKKWGQNQRVPAEFDDIRNADEAQDNKIQPGDASEGRRRRYIN